MMGRAQFKPEKFCCGIYPLFKPVWGDTVGAGPGVGNRPLLLGKSLIRGVSDPIRDLVSSGFKSSG